MEKEKNYKSVSEIADIFKVTKAGVYFWISKGLTYKTEKIIGRKTRKVLLKEDVEKFLKQGVK